MSRDEHNQFIELVNQGSEVDPRTLPILLTRAAYLGFTISEASKLVAVAGLKCPYRSHRDHIFQSAKSKLNSEGYKYELGWMFTHPVAVRRGLGSSLALGLIERAAGPIYATSALDDEHDHVHRMLERIGFNRDGQPFVGKKGRLLLLFVYDNTTTNKSAA